MRRSSNEMQVNVAGIRRNLKNFAHNYSDAQKKVREATSNDPWGPSSTIMAEIADLTYNVVAFSEIMQMVWKRLNDHGRNWRHVYKALVLLDYLIKTGSEKVGQQCKENIFAIQTLKDFTYMEEGKDQGQNVREKAKQLVSLLKDDERLKNERARALKAKERFAQSSSGFGSDGGLDTPSSPKFPAFRGEWTASRDSADLPRDIEIARPQTAGEEELQLQLALAMSREEAEQEEQKRKSDDVRLQLALSQSQQDFKTTQDPKPSHMVDLLDVTLGESSVPPGAVDPWGMPQPPRPQSSPWKSASLSPPLHQEPVAVAPPLADPWAPPSKQQPNPWVAPGGAKPHDPWSPASQGSTDLDEFDIITNRNRDGTLASGSPVKTNGATDSSSNDPFELNLLGDALSSTKIETSTAKKTPLSFLGENSALVNLDNLVTTTAKPTNPALAANPFSTEAVAAPNPSRPVFNTPPKPSINEIKQQQFAPFAAPAAPVFPTATQQGFNAFGTNGTVVPDPWTPLASAQQTNANGTNNPWMKSTNNEAANPFLS